MQKFAHGGHTSRRVCFISVCGTFVEHKWRSLKAACGPYLALFAKTQLFPLHFPFHSIPFSTWLFLFCAAECTAGMQKMQKKKKMLKPAQFWQPHVTPGAAESQDSKQSDTNSSKANDTTSSILIPAERAVAALLPSYCLVCYCIMFTESFHSVCCLSNMQTALF